jgi:4-hydroxythreonine-4-phosphate dehydrogenase
MKQRLTIGLTMGDPAGVGPELCLQTLGNNELHRSCRVAVFGHLDILRRVSRQSGVLLPPNLRVLNDPDQAGDEPAVINCEAPEAASIVPGKVSTACGAAAYRFIEAAIRAAQAGQIDAVVTAPIHKEALRLAGVPYPGHTEIFTVMTGARRTCMMLYSELLTVSMVTGHIGYAEVPQRLSVERIVDVIELTAEALERMKGAKPRLAVCGLNPHAGEHGLFGTGEEERLVEPAVQRARGRGFTITGPLPPDTAFTPDNRRRFDGFVCLYHDQGHIPFKMLAFDDGVNVTLGLPIVRTSVDHGTAFDIAWKGIARPTSLFKAVECAVRLASVAQ